MANKLNWGHKLTIFIILFMGMILLLVILSVNQNFHLVSEDYYEQEINYEEQMERIKNVKSLSEDVKFWLENEVIVIKFPDELKEKKIEGQLHFFRPSDSGKDLIITIDIDSSLIQRVKRAKLHKGFYRLKITWKAEGKEYYTENKVNL